MSVAVVPHKEVFATKTTKFKKSLFSYLTIFYFDYLTPMRRTSYLITTAFLDTLSSSPDSRTRKYGPEGNFETSKSTLFTPGVV